MNQNRISQTEQQNQSGELEKQLISLKRTVSLLAFLSLFQGIIQLGIVWNFRNAIDELIQINGSLIGSFAQVSEILQIFMDLLKTGIR